MNHSRSLYLVAIVLLTCVAFGVRAVSIDAQSLWRDEVDALCYAYEFPYLVVQTLSPQATRDLVTPCACPSLPVAPGQAPEESALRRLVQTLGGMIRQNGPLYFFLLRGWIAATGTSAYAMRFFSLVLGVLCVPLSYALGCRLFDRPTGLLAALLVTTSPYLTWYSHEVKMYTLVTALALLAIYGLRRAVEGDGWHWWAVHVVATSLAFYAHILAALLIPVQFLIYFVWWPRARQQWTGALVSLACLTLPYLPLALWQAESVLRTRDTGFYPYTLGQMAQILLNGWSLGILGQGWPRGAILTGSLAAWGVLSFLSSPPERRQEDVRNRLTLVCWLIVPLLAVWLISQRQPLFTDRYFIWASPPFYLLTALGLASVARFGTGGRGLIALLVIITLTFYIPNLRQQITEPIKSDFRAAVAYVAERYAPGELIIFQIPHGRYIFDYYFPENEYPWIEGLYTNHRNPDGSYMMSDQSAANQMQEATAAYNSIWLVATEVTMWDERSLVRAWLDEHRERVDEASFMRVDVYRYVK
jgi:mannosyltransferase